MEICDAAGLPSSWMAISVSSKPVYPHPSHPSQERDREELPEAGLGLDLYELYRFIEILMGAF